MGSLDPMVKREFPNSEESFRRSLGADSYREGLGLSGRDLM